MMQHLSAESGTDQATTEDTSVRSEAATMVIQAASGDQGSWSRLVVSRCVGRVDEPPTRHFPGGRAPNETERGRGAPLP